MFTVEFPVTKHGPALQPTPEREDRVTDALAGPDVLLVEDEPNTRQALTRLLETAGANVYNAGSAADAINLFKTSPPACAHRARPRAGS